MPDHSPHTPILPNSHTGYIHMAKVFISIGSNIDPEINIRRAILSLGEKVRITGISTFYCTEPLDHQGQPSFYNGIVQIDTEIPPKELKYSILMGIESELGRVRTGDKYAPRTIDLDVLIYDDLTLEEDGLTLPDPDIPKRPFLAIPLCELAPDIVLKGYGLKIRDLAKSHTNNTMEPLNEFTESLRRELKNGL